MKAMVNCRTNFYAKNIMDNSLTASSMGRDNYRAGTTINMLTSSMLIHITENSRMVNVTVLALCINHGCNIKVIGRTT